MAAGLARTAATAALTLLLAGATAAGERVQWQLDGHAAALYDRVHEVTHTPESRRMFWREAVNPPVLFGGELDEQRQYVKAPLGDLRDLPMRLAFDLRHAQGNGRCQIELPRTREFERALAVVSYGPVSDSGRQRVVALLRPGRPEGDRERRHAVALASGRIVLVRHLEADRGRVREFRSTFSLRTEAAQALQIEGATLQIREHWTWREDLRATDPAFQRQVDAAIRGGLEHLRGVLSAVFEREPTLAAAPPGSELRRRWMDPGVLGLVLLALVKCGADPQDPVIAQGLSELRRSVLRETYELSVALMTLEALHAPPRERERLIQGVLDRPEPRRLGPSDLALVSRWTEQLLESYDRTVDPGYVRRWRYRSGHDYDNSNTQYALLGLYSAKLCGVRVPAHVWMACVQHWLDERQETKEEPLRLRLTTHQEMREQKRSELNGHRTVTARRASRKDPPVAWGYHRDHLVSGSMTAAGISSLTICLAALERPRAAAKKIRWDVERAIRGGLAWFARHYTVRGVPGDPHSLGSRYYYLFGVERACELSSVALFQGRHWYFEGAVFLILMQDPRGSWGRWEDTAFAVLFLKKAVLPVLTGIR